MQTMISFTEFRLLHEFVLVPNYQKSRHKVPRSQQPQIKDYEEFKKFMQSKKIRVVRKKLVDPNKLLPTQHNFKMQDNFVGLRDKAIREKKIKDILISKDGYVIDGHHRWIATSLYPEILGFANVLEVQETFEKLRPLLRRYTPADPGEQPGEDIVKNTLDRLRGIKK